jgi:2-hydroxychromene-2-carboxylate isomerase
MPPLHELKFYFAYTSPYTYLAMEPAYALEQSHRVRIRFIPFGVNIRKTYGDAPTRSKRDQDKVRYLYQDARRFAKERGIVILPPRKIYSARMAFYGGLYADRHGAFHPYSDRVFERFWRHELEVEDPDAIAEIVTEAGLDRDDFKHYLNNDAKADLDRCFAEADHDKIFGVPTFVVDGELFWGHDRLDWVARKLDAMGLRH